MENITENLNKAVDLIANEDYSQAQSVLKQIVSDELLKKTNEKLYIEAQKNLGLTEVNLDNPIGAINAFLEVISLDNKDALSLFYLANCYSRTGQKELAVEKFEEVLKLRPDYLDAYKTLGMIYIEFNQPDNAIEIIKKAIENKELEPDYSLYYILATASMLKKDNTSAVDNLQKAYELDSDNLPVLNSLAVCYMNANRDEEAEDILLRAYKLDENNSLTTFNLGNLYRNLKDYKNALKYFQISYKLEPSISLLVNLADCALEAGEFSLACNFYQNLVAVYPANSQYLLSYVAALEGVENYSLALEYTEKLLELDEKNVQLLKKKGALLRKLGLFYESIDVFNILLRRGKIDIEVYYNLAFDFVEINEYDNAKEMFKKCITLEPNNPYAHKDLGVLYLKMNCYDWAVDEMKEAIALEDDVAEFYYSLGVANMMLGNYAQARVAFENCLKLDSNDADCLAYYGYLNLLENKRDKAFDILQFALKVDPNNFLAKNHIAKYYFQDKKYDVSKEFLLDIAQTTKDDETMNMLGVCYLETREFDSGAGVFSKLIANYPKNHILLTNLAKCEYKIGKKDEALEHIRQALMVFDDYDEALKLLEEINNG